MRIEQPSAFPATINQDTTIASGKSLIVTTIDKLSVGGIIVDPYLTITRVLGALDVSSALFIASAAYQVVGVKAAWGVAGGAAASLTVEKLTGTTAPGSGTALLTSGFDLTTTANTVLTGTLTSTTADLQLASGDRLGCKLGGVLTGLVGCALTIVLKRI